MKRDAFASRMWDRRRFDLRVTVTSSGDGTPEVIQGRTRDLSYQGIGLWLTRELPESLPVVITLRIAVANREIRLPAVLRHRRGFRCGFQFEKLSPESRIFVQQLHRALPA